MVDPRAAGRCAGDTLGIEGSRFGVLRLLGLESVGSTATSGGDTSAPYTLSIFAANTVTRHLLRAPRTAPDRPRRPPRVTLALVVIAFTIRNDWGQILIVLGLILLGLSQVLTRSPPATTSGRRRQRWVTGRSQRRSEPFWVKTNLAPANPWRVTA